MLDDLATPTPTSTSTPTSTPLPATSVDTATITLPQIEPTIVRPRSEGISLQAIVCAPEFSWDCGWALAVVWCESTNNPNAQAVEVIGGVTYYFNGLWQVLGGSFDPLENTRQAYGQWLEWQAGARQNPWPGC